MDIEAYLKRINYQGSLVPTAETLRDLQVAHLRAVPFENLSIHANESIVLDDTALFDKIVTRRRGGFCYELNGLFAALLRELGFEVARLSAGVANADGEYGPDFDHMALLVNLEDRWLADVGFGDSFIEPLMLDEPGAQTQGERAYKIVIEDDYRVLMRRELESDWVRQYRFTLKPHNYFDYTEMCRYHQTSPRSHFTQARICTRATPDGRITLSGLRFITTRNGQRHEQHLADESQYTRVLEEQFGVVLATQYEPGSSITSTR